MCVAQGGILSHTRLDSTLQVRGLINFLVKGTYSTYTQTQETPSEHNALGICFCSELRLSNGALSILQRIQ